MVAAVTGNSSDQIEWDMPLAKGLQFQALWLEMQGNITVPRAAVSIDSRAWKKISGR